MYINFNSFYHQLMIKVLNHIFQELIDLIFKLHKIYNEIFASIFLNIFSEN